MKKQKSPQLKLSLLYICYMMMILCCLPNLVRAASEDQVMRELARSNWQSAVQISRGAGSQGTNNFTRNLAYWNYLVRSEAIPPYQEYEKFLRQNPKAPLQDVLLKRMEIAFLNSNPTPRLINAWFRLNPAISSRAILLNLDTLNKIDKTQLNTLWVEADFSANEEAQFFAKYKNMIAQISHDRRSARLLWDNNYTAAARLYPYMSSDAITLAQARSSLQRKLVGFEGAIRAVPPAMQNDSGLLYDRIAFRASAGNYAGVKELLLKARAPLPYPDKWLNYQLRVMRDAIEQGDYMSAKIVADRHSQILPAPKVEAEWLRGWLYLSFLKQPKLAIPAFKNIYETALMPISRSRGAYWAARAYESAGDKQNAAKWYGKAALFPTAFFGQLAHQYLHPNTPLPLPALVAPAGTDLNNFKANDELASALERYVRAGYGGLLWNHLKHRLDFEHSPATFANLAAIARLAGDKPLAIKIAQEAANKGIYLSELFPVLITPKLSIDNAFALAITRQESRFDVRATSVADARGLMQILPSTGSAVASSHGLGFTPNRLYEPQYNMVLGAHYMHQVLGRFGGRMVLAIAGYNAGPGRPAAWQQRFGSITNKNMHQVIQWTEMIPFGETRNYVHRVMENYHVYRHLLSNGAVSLQAEQALTSGMRL